MKKNLGFGNRLTTCYRFENRLITYNRFGNRRSVGLGIDLQHVIGLGIDLGIVLNYEKIDFGIEEMSVWESTNNI